jgi:hypothetical protein
MLLASTAAEANRVFGSSKFRHAKQCDARTGVVPGYGSPRCRMQAPLACGERQIVYIFGFRYIHVGSCR